MASKAAQAELARKRCTPSSGVLVLPNTEVDSVAGVVEPSRDTHGYWPQKGASPFPKKGRLKAPADIHPGTQKQELEPKIEPSISQPCQRKRMCSRDESKRIKKRLHQLYQAMSNHVSNSIDLCRWSQPDTLRLVLWNHCPSQPKGSLMSPSPLTITANTPRTHQVTHFSDLWPAQSFRKWIKDCCHPWRHAHKATLCYIASCKHWQATILQTRRKALRQIRATTGIINKDKQFKTPLHKPFKTVENLSRHVKTFQVYKDPSACTMASKAAQAELARKRCTPSSGVPGSP